MADVEIRRLDDGTVRITGAPDPQGPDFTRAVLDASGAHLVWPDVTDLGLPNADVHDLPRAQEWLWAVYGERVAKACAAGETGPVAAEDTDLARVAARLAFGHWAARWWPASHLDGIPALAPDLLGVELAALTYQCQQLLDGSADDLLAELIEEHQSAVEPLIGWPPAEPVLRLVDEAADSLGLDGEPLRRLRSALDRPPVDAPVPLLARPEEYSLAAGDTGPATGRVIARGSGVNDWRRYPPGFVDAAEGAVSWTARAIGARRQVEVDAVAGDLPPAAGMLLAADVRVADTAIRVPLARHDDRWTGRADLTASGPIEVGVLLPGFDPGIDDDTRADREAVRALARRRLAGATDPFLAEIVAGA
jgi:hypothetical protein